MTRPAVTRIVALTAGQALARYGFAEVKNSTTFSVDISPSHSIEAGWSCVSSSKAPEAASQL